MDSALIVSFSDKSTEYLTKILQKASVKDIDSVSDAGKARRVLIDKDYDLCIVNSPLPDEFGANLARDIAVKKTSQVILLVKSEVFDEISYRVEEYGVITIAKPINNSLLWNALRLASATSKKIKAIREENLKLMQKIEDIRIVDRAKCILISNLSMTEAEAHRYIEKQAMDMRLPKRKVAEEILKIYEY
ncbi:MAG: ANTAR domain-containing protein [Clostridiaceae bacterium]|nr:ANTAR domain-containing protein [Clostridiaceae bacterium]